MTRSKISSVSRTASADEVDLHGRLAAPERVDDRCRRDETVREPAVRECLLELEPEPVGQAVRSWVAPRVVERDRTRREAFQRLTQRGLDALVIADHVVAADLLDGRCVEAADDRDSLTRRRDDERARPGAVRPRDQVETRVAREHRLANESEPDVRVLLAQDVDRLIELLLDEGRRRGHGC